MPLFPFPTKLHAILHYLCNTDPTFTRKHARSVLWAFRQAGVKNVPSYAEIVALRKLVPTPDVFRANCVDGRTGIFYMIPPTQSLKFWAVHPHVMPHMKTLPRKAGGAVRDFMDTPRARELFEQLRIANIVVRGEFYFVDDFIEWREPPIDGVGDGTIRHGRIKRLERLAANAEELDREDIIIITIERVIIQGDQVFTIDEVGGAALELVEADLVNVIPEVCADLPEPSS